ncbi:ATP-binding protein [Blastococcus sp. BMG 814]|uniref:ATP-binding protein n=1 Tax=Blastococcus carthaginiensis TaxID=3050034 RepID=A0ABT9I7P8_9ACTN|nr:ATP-binding protein [Blastococcus carthaginiensis]MDP5181595.1 ATP-binding protein [Blastococcus carthaginiensis]
MTTVARDIPAEEIRAVVDFAALSGHFDPGAALGAAPTSTTDRDRTVDLAAHLARVCDTRPGEGRGSWVIRGPERRWALERLAERTGIPAAVTWRRGAGAVDAETADLLDALEGRGDLAHDAVRARIVAGGPRRDLERIVVALDRSGPLAPAWLLLDAARAVLVRLDATDRNEILAAADFVDRDAERSQIVEWLHQPFPEPPVRALFVSGTAGMGKSTLLEEVIRSARASMRPWVVVRLDFDRGGLEVQDLTALTVELARQVAADLTGEPHALREARLRAAGAPVSDPLPAVKGELRERIPMGLLRVTAELVRTEARPVLLVLDTLEALRSRGETHPARLFDWIDQLLAAGLGPLAVLAAGRGDALGTVPGRVGRRIDLGGLDDVSADRLLAHLGVPAQGRPAARSLAQGNPLVLRLAATVVREAGTQALARARHRKGGVAAAFLYRMLLSRIADEPLRRLAHPGLVVRRINADVIAEVLAPHLGLGRIGAARAEELLAELSREHWLVEPDPVAPGFVRHRADTRRDLVQLLYDTRPARAATVDRAAAAWFAARPEPWAAVEAAYHRLQLMRRDTRAPYLDPAVLQRLGPETLAELPQVARDLVHRSRGERSVLVRGAAPGAGGPPVPGAAAELAATVERGDWLEGSSIYDRALRGRLFDARSPEADAALAFLWRSGQWSEARRLLAERDRASGDDGDLARLHPHLAAPRWEMRAEFSFDALVHRLTRDPRQAVALADVVRRGLPSELSEGALGFALWRAGSAPRNPPWRGFDAVGAAWATWLPSGTGQRGAGAGAARERLDRAGSPATTSGDPAGEALLLAALTPYAAPVVTLDRVRSAPTLERHAAAVARRLAGPGGLPVTDHPASPPGAPGPSGAIDGLSVSGLLAEWAGAAAFLLADPDLVLLARSAERWRRTMAGRWSYGAALPSARRGWSRPLDVILADRVAALESVAGPGTAAHEHLAAWSGDDRADPTPVITEIGHRRGGALTAGRAVADRGAPHAAAALLEHRMPAAFVPPLAVLLARGEI